MTILLIIIAVLLLAIALGHPGSREVLSLLLTWTLILGVAGLLLALVASVLVGLWSLIADVPADKVLTGLGSVFLFGLAAWIVITLIASAVQLVNDANKRQKLKREAQAGLLRAAIFSISCLAGLVVAGTIVSVGILLVGLLVTETRNSVDMKTFALVVPAALGPIAGIALVPILSNRLERLFARWTDVLQPASSKSEPTDQ